MAKSHTLCAVEPASMRCALFVIVPLALAASSVQAATGTAGAPSAADVRKEVRRAVETHRALERDDIRREESEIGRRLTPAERAELREQIRYQWLLPSKLNGGPRPDDALGSGSPGASPATAPATASDGRRPAP